MPSKPDKESVLNFIYHTHSVERINIKMSQIRGTLDRKVIPPEPFTDGHLRAIASGLRLINEPHFPVNNSKKLRVNVSRARIYLQWIKDLHVTMFETASKDQELIERDDETRIYRRQLGKYRDQEALLGMDSDGVGRWGPHPDLIEPLLINWMSELSELDEEYYEKTKRPMGISRGEALKLSSFAEKSSLLFAATHPFEVGSNRTGRLLENLIRARWGFPWRIIYKGDQYKEYIKNINNYADNNLKQIISKAQEKLNS